MVQPLGSRPPRMAYRMFGHVDHASRRNIRHPWRWHGPDFSASRKRDRPILRGHGKGIRQLLDSQRLRADQSGKNVEVPGEFFHHQRDIWEVRVVGDSDWRDTSLLLAI